MVAKSPKVFVGLSGGVDSAVSAALLKEAGYEVIGVFIKILLSGYPCPAAKDRVDAMRVAAHLRIPFVEVDLSEQYAQKVFGPSVKAFAVGNTPNPDALCNREIKFGLFYAWAREHGADFVATGHYARIAPYHEARRVHEFSAENSLNPRAVALRSPSEPHSIALYTGKDTQKDQSYFLWMVPEATLRHALFPIGSLTKQEVRALAKKYALPNAERPDSQGLCFLGAVSLPEMLDRELTHAPGAVLDEAGSPIGTHNGSALYTIGQRHGFTLTAAGPHTKPHFVIAKDIEHNTITVSLSPKPSARSTLLRLTESNWIGELPHTAELGARYRYRQKLIPATLYAQKDEVLLHEGHYVPLGQSLVLYDGERCLGGGIISDATLQI